jgi:hypothetical protein
MQWQCTRLLAPLASLLDLLLLHASPDMKVGVQHILCHGVCMLILVDVVHDRELPLHSVESTLLVSLSGGGWVGNLAQNVLKFIVKLHFYTTHTMQK